MVSHNGVWRCLSRDALDIRADRLALCAGYAAPYERPGKPQPPPGARARSIFCSAWSMFASAAALAGLVAEEEQMSYPFVQARNYTSAGRKTIDLVVVHTMEAPDKPETAENVARWFAGSSAPQASAHYCVDADSVVQSVRDEDIAWHAPGANHNGIGLEHAGFARFTGADWADDYNRRMLDRSATLVASLCRAYRIPPLWLYPADLMAGRRGITSHVNVSQAFRRSDHSDPGTSFPVQAYLRQVQEKLKAGGPVETKPLKDAPPMLRRGDEGSFVMRLQRLLRARGFDAGQADGIFGPATERAVSAFQAKMGLDSDGIAGRLTWRALEAAG
jgi:N-acetyl-anhydromuramyl-L-alanine amidase AmpD